MSHLSELYMQFFLKTAFVMSSVQSLLSNKWATLYVHSFLIQRKNSWKRLLQFGRVVS